MVEGDYDDVELVTEESMMAKVVAQLLELWYSRGRIVEAGVVAEVESMM
jgi:hypothetical protein